jgi:hypothetical protein
MKRYTGIQPQYFPRLHYFARILNTDVYMIRDEAQFVRSHSYPSGGRDKSYQADTPIKQPTGRSLMSVPIIHNGYQPIAETKIAYERTWVADHIKTLEVVYGKAENFKTLIPQVRDVFIEHYKTRTRIDYGKSDKVQKVLPCKKITI